MQDENIQKVESLVKALLAIGEAQNRGAQGLFEHHARPWCYIKSIVTTY